MMFGIAYLYCKVSYSKTTPTINFKNTPEDFCQMQFLDLMFQDLQTYLISYQETLNKRQETMHNR